MSNFQETVYAERKLVVNHLLGNTEHWQIKMEEMEMEHFQNQCQQHPTLINIHPLWVVKIFSSNSIITIERKTAQEDLCVAGIAYWVANENHINTHPLVSIN